MKAFWSYNMSENTNALRRNQWKRQNDNRREADEHIIVKNQSIKVWLNDHEHVQKTQI